jgi:hypothetical protein
MADHNFRSDRGGDPIAELARLIGQAVPHGESAPADRGWREGTASEGYEEPTRLPPVPQLPGRLNAPEEAYELDRHRHDEKVCDAGDQPWAAAVDVPVARRNYWGNDGFGFFFQRNWNPQPANTRPRAGQYYQPMQQRWW